MLPHYIAKIAQAVEAFYNHAYVKFARYLAIVALAAYAVATAISLVMQILPWLLVGAGLGIGYKVWEAMGGHPPAANSSNSIVGVLTASVIYTFIGVRSALSFTSGLWGKLSQSPTPSASIANPENQWSTTDASLQQKMSEQPAVSPNAQPMFYVASALLSQQNQPAAWYSMSAWTPYIGAMFMKPATQAPQLVVQEKAQQQSNIFTI